MRKSLPRSRRGGQYKIGPKQMREVTKFEVNIFGRDTENGLKWVNLFSHESVLNLNFLVFKSDVLTNDSCFDTNIHLVRDKQLITTALKKIRAG